MTDLELLARIIQCEAGGEGINGMRAVATVIMNRVREMEGEYGRYNTIRDVIFAPRQFDCATTAYGPQHIWNANPEQIHYDLAQEAISGGELNEVAEALWYFNPFMPECREQFPDNSGVFSRRIGDHCFYIPTSDYYLT